MSVIETVTCRSVDRVKKRTQPTPFSPSHCPNPCPNAPAAGAVYDAVAVLPEPLASATCDQATPATMRPTSTTTTGARRLMTGPPGSVQPEISGTPHVDP